MAEWRRFSASCEIGVGADVFARVGDALSTWGIQRGSGLRVVPDSPVRLGGEHVVRIGIGRARLNAPVHICEIVDDDGAVHALARRGFAYETRDGHPEEGVEWFVVEHDLASDRVSFVVSATARAASWYARLGGPVTRYLQDMMTRRYLRAAARIASGDVSARDARSRH